MEKWVQSLRADGFIGEGKEVSVTGYSLGAHLATVFNILHNYKESDIYCTIIKSLTSKSNKPLPLTARVSA